jgi:hypothetical protein
MGSILMLTALLGAYWSALSALPSPSMSSASDTPDYRMLLEHAVKWPGEGRSQ